MQLFPTKQSVSSLLLLIVRTLFGAFVFVFCFGELFLLPAAFIYDHGDGAWEYCRIVLAVMGAIIGAFTHAVLCARS